MSKFERIIREPLVMGGQARIRDTGITVNEIVRLSLAGSSQVEILQKFPMLEAEDVHEALGYAMSEIGQGLTNWRVSKHHPILLAFAAIDKLHEELKDKSTEVNYERVEKLLDIANKSILLSNVHSHFMFILYSAQYTEARIELYSLERLLTELQHDLMVFSPSFDLEYTIPDKPIKFNAAHPIGLAIRNLLIDENGNSTKGTLKIEVGGSKLLFTIIRPDHMLYQDLDFQLLGHRFIAVSNLIIYQHGSDLKIRPEDNSVIFEFALPIVEG